MPKLLVGLKLLQRIAGIYSLAVYPEMFVV